MSTEPGDTVSWESPNGEPLTFGPREVQSAHYYWLDLKSARDWLAMNPANQQWAFTVKDGDRSRSFTLAELEEMLEPPQ